MRFEAIVKVLQDVKAGVSQAKGTPYRYQGMVLEAQDGQRTACWLASVGNELVDKVAQEGIKVGSRVVVDIYFTTVVNYNKFIMNKVYVDDISLLEALPMPEVPKAPL